MEELPVVEESKELKNNFLLILLSFVVLITSLLVSVFNFPQKLNNANVLTDKIESKTPSVLGMSNQQPRVFISGGKENSGLSGGVIALSSEDQQAITVTSYQYSGNVEFTLYEANKEELLKYLVHDSENKQVNLVPNTDGLGPTATFNQSLTSSSNYNYETLVTLPLRESGIWILKMKTNFSTEYAFIIRSRTGIINKEGNNENIFWGQDFKSGKSIDSGSIKVYDLNGSVKEISSSSFDNSGIAKIPLLKEADLALVEINGDLSLVPINLRYLNSRYQYQSFAPKQKSAQYFIFTDRPLYRPGNTIYFKAVVRDDDDVRYTLPSGSALVKIYKDWDEKNVVFEKNINVSPDGTVFGEFKLPDDAAVGYYNLKVELPGYPLTSYWGEWSSNYISFQVEYYRKPEYGIDISVPKSEIIAKDDFSFEISGNYFSGSPISGKEVKYSVYSGDFTEYQYFSNTPEKLSDDYRWGRWAWGDSIASGSAMFDDKGKAVVKLDTQIKDRRGKNQVFSIEASFDDGSGNPSFARKNILVYAGEYNIFRKDTSYGTKVGTPFSLPVILKVNRQTSLNSIPLMVKIHRENWIAKQEEDKKYPTYIKEEEDLPGISVRSDSNGEATIKLIPKKIGSYTLTVSGEDEKGNLISKAFYFWVSDKDTPFYSGSSSSSLTIKADKETYLPADTASLTILSDNAGRDVFLSFERGRVNRYKIVHLDQKSQTFEVPLVDTDIPNIYVKAESFSPLVLNEDIINLVVSPESKRMLVKITPDKEKYGPKDTVSLEIQTTDVSGNPISADLAVWTVDKALFELIDKKQGSVFDAFWHQRGDNTSQSHSLEGILVLTAEGGGCFASGTKVLMADGISKNIEEIKPGEYILTRKSDRDESLIKAKVKSVHQTIETGYLIINQSLKLTANHILWVNDSWKEAGSVVIGDKLLSPEGKSLVVSSFEWQAGKFPVYNLEIEKLNTFFAEGIWVHNQKGDLRNVFKDTAYWNPSVHTGLSGKASLKFKLPDNLTTWVITALGATIDTKAGESTGEIKVAKDLVIKPILPNILRKDDQIVLSAIVQNFTDKDQSFDAGLMFDSGEINKANYNSVLVKANDTVELSWEVTPNKENKQAKLTFSLQSTEDSKLNDVVENEIEVLSYGFSDKKTQVGDGPVIFPINLSPQIQIEKTDIRLSLSPSLAGVLLEPIRYLIDYPYGCTEQTTGNLVSAMMVKNYSSLIGFQSTDINIDAILKQSIKRLIAQQLGNGGWTWWRGNKPEMFITSYVVENLLEAKKMGLKIDENVLSMAKNCLSNKTFYNPKVHRSENYSFSEEVARLYGLSLLEPGKNLLEQSILEKDLSADVLALAVMTNIRNGDNNPKTNGLTKLISLAQTKGDTFYWPAGPSKYFGSQDASTALATRAISASGLEKEALVKAIRYLSRTRKKYWSNTFATSQVIKAILDYTKTSDELAANFDYSVLLDGTEIAKGTVNNPKQTIKEIIISPKEIKQLGSQLTIKKNGDGQLYSTLTLTELLTDKKMVAVSNGLSVSKQFENENGGKEISVGDTVLVKVDVDGFKGENLYGLIADELPSGLIPINTSLKNEQSEMVDYSSGTEFNYYPEFGLNGVVIYLPVIDPQNNTYTYKARAVSAGTFGVLPSRAELMYFPEINGRSKADQLVIGKKAGVSLLNYAKGLSPVKIMNYLQKILRILFIVVITALFGGGVYVFIKKRKMIFKRPQNFPDNSSDKNAEK